MLHALAETVTFPGELAQAQVPQGSVMGGLSDRSGGRGGGDPLGRRCREQPSAGMGAGRPGALRLQEA